MDNTISNNIIFNKIISIHAKKILVYTSAAILFAASPAQPVSAAETASQTESISVPAETPGSSTSNTETPPAQTPADPTTITTDTPADTITITPLPEPAPAEQNSFEVTPMQGTVYAASQKGLNVRSGPSTNHGKLGTLKYGQEITVTGKTADNWYQIQYSGGVGYVNADFVSDTPPASVQTPPVQEPSSPLPAPENPDTDAEQVPPAVEPGPETGSETQTEDDSSEEGNTIIVSNLIGTPVYIVLAVAIVGVLALIGYSIYSLFKKDSDTSDENYEDEYYEDSDEEYYEDIQPDSDEEFYEDNEQYSDEEYYEDGEQYPDEEYYEDDEQYSDEEYYENSEQYSDEEYYENNEQDADNEYYEDNDNRR